MEISLVGTRCGLTVSNDSPLEHRSSRRQEFCGLLQTATISTCLKEQHFALEQTFTLMDRFAGKVQPGELDLPDSATATHAIIQILTSGRAPWRMLYSGGPSVINGI
jgi:hypothetical protein